MGTAAVSFVTLLSGAAGAQQLLPAQRYLLGGSGDGAGATADFNSDGRPDLATANVFSDDVAVAFGNGTGGFESPRLMGVGDGPVALVAVDFDGDAAADIATANEDTNDVSVLMGVGDGTFGLPASHAVGFYPQDIVAADVNADGHVDLVTADCLSSQVSVLLNDALGSFAPAQPSTTDWYYPMRLDAGDLDGDGDIDLAFVDYNEYLHLLFGKGTGGFSAPSGFASFVAAIDVTVADVNLDGNLDLLAPGTGFSDQVQLLIGTGGGGFDPAIPVETPVPNAAFCADVDLDGLPDLVTADGAPSPFSFPGVSVLRATAPAAFAPAVSMASGGPTRYVVALDLNEDGWPDLVTPNGGYDVTVYVAAGDGNFHAPFSLYAAVATMADFEAVDLDANGLPDLVTCGNESIVSVQLAKLEGGFQPAAHYPIASSSWTSDVAVGDLDGDKVADVVTCNAAGTVSVLLGDGAGGFGPADIDSVSMDLVAVELGDMNDDDWLDIVTSDSHGSAWVLLNDATGHFPQATAHVIGKPAFTMALADVNADGGLDIVAELTASTGGQPSNLTVLLGDNAGGFQPALVTPLSPKQKTMALGDVDSDGFPDLVTAATSGTEVRPGNGDGLFGAPSLSLAGTTDVGLGDLNGDGRLDLLTHALGHAGVRLGDGAGAFAEPLDFTSSHGYGRILAKDMNTDGAPDIVTGGSVSGEFGFANLTLLYNLSPNWAWGTLGDGLAGTHGVPTLAGSGALAAGNVVSLTLDQALENSTAALVVGLSVVNLPFKGGIFVPNADIVFLGMPTGPFGTITLTSTWPAYTPPRSQVVLQYWILDPAGVQGFSASNAAVCTSP